MSPYDVIQSPLLSEKAYQGMATGRYTFWVQLGANKSLRCWFQFRTFTII